MSGIAGALAWSDQWNSKHLVRRLTTRLLHRGSHGVDHWDGEGISLGQCMLRATPRSATEVLPLVNVESGLVLVMDGRIDNRNELYRQLKPRFDAVASPDSVYVLEAYRQWGESCAEHLLGDFAFALWDGYAHKLYCARDHIGARTLYYVQVPGYFAFASEVEALLHLPEVSSAPNQEQIASLLVPAFANQGDKRTWNRDVMALMESECLTVDIKGNINSRCYWQASPAEELNYSADHEAGEHFFSVFKTAVADRMSALGDTAMMLSGGLDSAGIAVAASQLAQSPVHGYSAVDDEVGSCLESQSILSMVDSLGIRSHRLSVPSFSGMISEQDLLDAAWNQAHPVDSALLLPTMMALAASRKGHCSLMHGVSGDLAWHAPLYYQVDLIRNGKIRAAWRESRFSSENNVYLKNIRTGAIFRRSFVVAMTSAKTRHWLSKFRRFGKPSAIETSAINPDFARKLDLHDRIVEQELSNRVAAGQDARLAHFRSNLAEVRSGLSGFSRATARYGLEASDPWADRRVLELLYRLPLNFRVHKGWTKYLLRSCLASELPSMVVWRKDKAHLGWKFAARFMEVKHSQVQQLLLDDLEELGQYVSIGIVRDLSRKLALQFDYDLQDELFGYVTLILWLKRLKSDYQK